MEARKIINGSFGELWLDGDYIGEAKGCQAKIEINKEEVSIVGQLAVDTKVMGWTGKGSMTLYKANSKMIKKVAQLVKEGKDVRFSLISKLADPDAEGTERIAIKNISFDDLTLIDWELKKVLEVECPFTFTDYEVLDEI